MQLRAVTPIVVTVVAVIVWILRAPHVKAEKEKQRKEAEKALTVPLNVVPKDQIARRYDTFWVIMINMGGLLPGVIIGAVFYEVFGILAGPQMKLQVSFMVSFGFWMLWMLVVAAIVTPRRVRGRCPKCRRYSYYRKADRDLFMFCRVCKQAWKAESSPE